MSEPHAASIREFLRFVAVGVLNTADYYLLFVALNRVTWYLVAHVAAFATSMVISFFLNCYVTYRVRPTLRKFLLFPATNAVNFVVTSAGMTVLVSGLAVDPRVAAIAVAFLAVPFTFALSRRILRGTLRSAQDYHRDNRQEIVVDAGDV